MSTDAPLDDFAFGADFAVYQHFDRLGDLEATAAFLRDNGVLVRTGNDEAGGWRETVIMGSPLRPKYWLEIPSADFKKADYLLQEAADETLTPEFLAEHPFADYTPAELTEVITHAADWNPEAVVVAKHLLLRAQPDVDLTELQQRTRAHEAARFEPKQSSPFTIGLFAVLGFVAGLMVWWIFFMLFAGMLAYYVLGSSRDSRGDVHMDFDATTRRYGLIGLGVAGLGLVIGVANLLLLNWYYAIPLELNY